MISRGSEWRRWEPHIHAPGTAMNDQFTGPNAWDDYLTALEKAAPVIEAIAVTDYYVTDTYAEVRRHQANGRLPSVQLVLPSVEVRLDVATAKGGFVNLHLLVSPEDPKHVEEVQRLLSRLHFTVMGDRFDCTRADLIRLGRRADPSITDDGAALSYGASQFKVNFQTMRQVFTESDWAKKNVLIAVAGGARDGTSGVREAADQTIRREIESFAHIIFAGSPAQREFWLGQRDLTPDEIKARYGGLKPCLHGSDAHRLDQIASPFGERFSWIKGGLEFDSLRQASIDPGGRSHIGAEPPASATPSQVIAQIDILDAPWLMTPSIPLNPGLVAVIGARGSGKTALADMVAAGCDAISDEAWQGEEAANPSFLVRARPLIGEGKVRVSWASGESNIRALDGSDANGPQTYPRVRYLSQRFVEDLCSSSGMTDGLLREIERVIFDAHPEDETEDALDFEELLERRAARFRQARVREAEAVSQISERISTELEKERLAAHYEALVAQKTKLIAGYTTDRAKLVSAGSEKRADRHTQIAEAANKMRAKIRAMTNQRQTFVVMQDEVKDLRRNRAPEMLRQTQSRHSNSGMDAAQWAAFLLDYKGPVDDNLAGYIKWADNELSKLKGQIPPAGDPNAPYFADTVDMATLSLAVLEAEMGRLEKLVSADKETQRRYAALSSAIATETVALQSLTDKWNDAKGAKDRARELQDQREEAYGRAFDALVAEQKVLEDLYAPLMDRLSQSAGTLKKLSFSVARHVDIDQWSNAAEEELLDLRKGDFRGRGTLAQKAREVLKAAWETGDAKAVVAAMVEFRRLYQKALLEHSPVAQTDQGAFRNWSKRFAQWLYSIDHIGINYGIQYDGVDISKLSPGTRGIVLLLLYLALDDSDNRPLVIDQPEENLDPKSVFDELVGLFILAKANRQVIIVTHNANLVVNTDADQVIVAQVGPHPEGALPPITYRSGGLENADIRKTVCDVLEGGELAFRERARRLRVKLDR